MVWYVFLFAGIPILNLFSYQYCFGCREFTLDSVFGRLIGLKNIFARQLPNMPKEYIVRLVMDRYAFAFYLVFSFPLTKHLGTYICFVQNTLIVAL